jgi:iron(III) transport system substrate-binding protein
MNRPVRETCCSGLLLLTMAIPGPVFALPPSLPAVATEIAQTAEQAAPPPAPEPPRPALTIYTSFDPQRLAAAFTDFGDSQKVTIRIESDEADLILGRLLREGGTSAADLLLIPGLSRLERAATAGLLQALQNPDLEKTSPVSFRDTQNRWYGIAAAARTIVTWNDKIKPGEVSGIKDLAKPAYKGRICMVPLDRLSSRTFIAAWLAGQDSSANETLLRAIAANRSDLPEALDSRLTSDGDDRALLQALAARVCDIALIGSRTLARLADKGDDGMKATLDKITVQWPVLEGRGTPADLIGIGTTVSSSNKELVGKFLAYVASDNGQRRLAEALWAYPIKSGVPLSNPVTRWGPLKIDPTPVSILQTLLPKAGALGETLMSSPEQ